VTLGEALKLDLFKTTRIVAGHQGLNRKLNGVSVVDIPDPLPWVCPDQLLLTTGYAWPRDEQAFRKLLQDLGGLPVSGIGMAIPQFFDEFPPVAREIADTLKLPLLEIPWEIPFVQITEAIHNALLSEQSIVIERSEEIHRELVKAASEASSLQDIVETLGKLIKRDITLEDADGHLIAHAGHTRAKNRTRNPTTKLGKSRPEVLQVLRERGYLDIKKLVSPLKIPDIPELDLAARVVCSVRVKKRVIGLIWILQDNRPLTELDLRAAEHAATVVALHLTHQEHIVQQERQLGFSFIESLLEGRFEQTPANLERAWLFGFDPNGVYQVGAILIHEPVPLTAKALRKREHISNQIRKNMIDTGVKPLVSVVLNRVVFILPEDKKTEEILYGLKAGEKTVLLGRYNSGIEGVRTSYEEALSMRAHARLDEIHHYEDWIIPRVLLGDEEARKALHNRIFAPLYKQRKGDRLAETLVAWVRASFNVSRTADELGVHRNTFYSRLRRLEQALNCDFEDPRFRFELQLAVEYLGIVSNE
jgi:purine catabolism regulator